MKVYILREGNTNVFKIGRTRAEDVAPRLRTLNCGSSQGLTVFDVVQCHDAGECEAMFHSFLASKRVIKGGGTEFFEMESEDHMRKTIEEVKEIAAEHDEKRALVSQYEHIQCSEILLEPTPEDKRLLARLLEIEGKIAPWEAERKSIRNTLKCKIGMAKGIRGVAVWNVRKCFSDELFRLRDPDSYEEVFERFHCIDRDSWKSDEPGRYQQALATYFTITRVFRAGR